MGHVKTEVSSTYYVPASKELLVHILLDFLCHFLLIGTVLESMADHMLGLKLDFGFHFGIDHLDSPLFGPLLQ